MIKIAHIGDIHYCDKYLEEVRRCMDFAVKRIIKEKCDFCVIPGDLYDRTTTVHSPAHEALVGNITSMAKNGITVVILQGTRSHDIPGSLKHFQHIPGVRVIDNICVTVMTAISGKKLCILSLPPVNKAQLNKFGGDVDSMAGEVVFNLMRDMKKPVEGVHAVGTPAILIGHGTVSHSENEYGVPMAGNDWELTDASMFASGADAVMLNHIHKHQSFSKGDIKAAYAGSIGRLHFGEKGPKGFLIWHVDIGKSSFEFVETPARKLMDIEFDGPPDLEKIEKIARENPDVHIRLNYSVNEENLGEVDRIKLREILGDKAQINQTIIHKERVRAQGISSKKTIKDKFLMWCEATGTDPETADLVDDLIEIEEEALLERVRLS